MVTWTPAQAVTFLETARATKNRYCPLFATAIYIGARLGESLGIRWTDVDLDAGTFVVQQTLEKSDTTPRFGTPKSAKSRRIMPLPADLVAILKTWKAEQKAERLLLGPAYRDQGLVFTIPGGRAVR